MKNILDKITNVIKGNDVKYEQMYNSYKVSTGVYRGYDEIEKLK